MFLQVIVLVVKGGVLDHKPHLASPKLGEEKNDCTYFRQEFFVIPSASFFVILNVSEGSRSLGELGMTKGKFTIIINLEKKKARWKTKALGELGQS